MIDSQLMTALPEWLPAPDLDSLKVDSHRIPTLVCVCARDAFYTSNEKMLVTSGNGLGGTKSEDT